MLKKRRGDMQKRDEKTHESLIENLAKMDKKSEENRVGNNSPPKNGSWDRLLAEKLDFGSILGSLGKPLGRP